jgi:hypothetical protein
MNKQNEPLTANPQPTYNKEASMAKEKAEQVQEKTSEMANKAQQQASAFADQAKTEAKSSLQAQKDVAAQELHGVAEALRKTGSNLREQDQTMFADYSNRLADGVERASNYLENHSLDDFVYEVEDFARRKPELFIGGAFTLGLLAARFLKSSAPSFEDDTRMDTRGYYPPSPGRTYSDRPFPYDENTPAQTMPRTGETDSSRYNRIRS